MKILIIRHGDPDYSIDSLTPTGWKEAKLLADKLVKMNIDAFYVSPLGRAKDTASYTLKAYEKEAVEYDWLREFPAQIWRPDIANHKMIAWDWLPEDWTAEPRFFDRTEWKNVPCMQEGQVGPMYDAICEQFDALLAKHGYERDGLMYRAVSPNEDTIAFFCHFGLGSVLLSHLMNVSPMVLWHGFCAAPSSVSSLISEERREGKAYFRAQVLGDVSHLYAAGEEPSFAARFCECFANKEERHD